MSKLIEMTKNQFKRASRDMEKRAGESVETEFSNGDFWVFCSELAARRIAHEYRNCPGFSMGKIENESHPHYGKWYFLLEMPSFCGSH